MGKYVISLLIICLFFIDPSCYARMPVKVSDHGFEIRDNTFHISHDILNSNPDEKYVVSIAVKDEDKDNQAEAPTEEIKAKNFNRAGIVIQSLALPGLGLSRVTGNPHWIRGVAGYGCIAGSIVLNRQAVSTFNTIGGLDNVDDVNEAFDKSVQQDKLSEILAYAAIGIWVADLIWTVADTSDLKKRPLNSQSKGFSIKSNFDPMSNIPMVSFSYTF